MTPLPGVDIVKFAHVNYYGFILVVDVLKRERSTGNVTYISLVSLTGDRYVMCV